MKSSFFRASSAAACFAWAMILGIGGTVSAQISYYTANGTEYSVAGALPGDQVFPDVAISTTNGIVVWQDNATDGDGWGISAQRLDSTLSGTLSPFRVNVTGAGDQEHARVALLKNAGAVFVWQGGKEGYQHIFARYLTPTNTFLTTTDLMVSTFTNATSFQVSPAVTVLDNSNVVVVWSSFNQVNSNSLLDVYGKILSPSGATVSNTFLVNQFTNYNQRTPAVTALKGGRFVVAWVSEQQRTKSATTIDETNGTYVTQINTASVDIYARLFQSNGAPVAAEFLVSTSSIPCANPSLAAGSDGGFMVAWSGRDVVVITNGWDVYGRPFGSNAVGGATVRLNSYLAEAQYAPHLSAIGEYFLAVWTSMGQDGSGEGVYGQFVRNNATLVGSEFRVNTTTVGRQMHPAVASDGANQFMAVWTSYTSITNLPHSYDLYAQRYQNVAAVLAAMSAPYVWAPFTLSNNIYQPQLVVTWAPVAGLSVADYEVYVDGGSSATGVVTSNVWTMTSADGLSTNSTHSFTVDYLLTDGRRSPISASTSGSTWLGGNYYGIPSEWMYEYFGYSYSDWPKASVALDSSGYTLYQVFICGGNPLDASTWLKQTLSRNSEGLFLSWNTQEGAIYQVLVSTNMTTWDSFGSPRFAAGTNDSVNVSGSKAGYYRVNLLR